MNITKNTVTFTAEEYKGIMLRFSDVLTAHLNLVRAIAEEETLRQKHRSYLETRAKIFGSIAENEKLIDDACELVDRHLSFCGICRSFEPDSEASVEKHSGEDCKNCELREVCDSADISDKNDKKAEESTESVKEILEIIADAASDILDLIYEE